MTTLREAAQQALEALEICAVRQEHQWHGLQQVQIVKAALRAALEQPEQEPVAWLDEEINCAYTPQELDGCSADGLLPLYTHPPRREWRSLSEEEIRDLWSWSATAEAERTATTQQHAFARAVEAALKERNI